MYRIYQYQCPPDSPNPFLLNHESLNSKSQNEIKRNGIRLFETQRIKIRNSAKWTQTTSILVIPVCIWNLACNWDLAAIDIKLP